MKPILDAALVLTLVARMHVTFVVAGVSVPLLLLRLVTAVAFADIVAANARAIPGREWPVLYWRRGLA